MWTRCIKFLNSLTGDSDSYSNQAFQAICRKHAELLSGICKEFLPTSWASQDFKKKRAELLASKGEFCEEGKVSEYEIRDEFREAAKGGFSKLVLKGIRFDPTKDPSPGTVYLNKDDEKVYYGLMDCNDQSFLRILKSFFSTGYIPPSDPEDFELHLEVLHHFYAVMAPALRKPVPSNYMRLLDFTAMKIINAGDDIFRRLERDARDHAQKSSPKEKLKQDAVVEKRDFSKAVFMDNYPRWKEMGIDKNTDLARLINKSVPPEEQYGTDHLRQNLIPEWKKEYNEGGGED